MEFSRLEYWRGLPFPSPGDLPNSGIKPRSPALQVDSLPSEPSPSVFSKMSYSCQLITHLECILYSLFTSFFSLLDLQSLDLATKVAPLLTPFALALDCSMSVSQTGDNEYALSYLCAPSNYPWRLQILLILKEATIIKCLLYW